MSTAYFDDPEVVASDLLLKPQEVHRQMAHFSQPNPAGNANQRTPLVVVRPQ